MAKQFIGVTKCCQRCGATEEFKQNVEPPSVIVHRSRIDQIDEAKKELARKHVSWFPLTVGQTEYELCPKCLDAFRKWADSGYRESKSGGLIALGHATLRAQIEVKVTGIIKEGFDVDLAKIKPTATLMGDLGADSMALVELSIALEEVFEPLRIPDDVFKVEDRSADSITVQDVVDYVERQIKEKP